MGDRTCFVYAICYLEDGEFTGPVKIGISAAPTARLRELQIGSPRKLAIVFCANVSSRESARRIEVMAHEDAAPWAMSGEWFDLEPGHAVGLLAAGLVTEHGGRITMIEDRGVSLQ
jgi:hypothetical protein